ncbi:putative pectinesterase [Helianthus anomalus]
MKFRNTVGLEGHQAVAFLSTSDTSKVYQCSIEGYQDMLFTISFRHIYTTMPNIWNSRFHFRRQSSRVPRL